MSPSKQRLLLLVLSMPVFVLLAGLLYMLGMSHLEGDPRDFWRSLAWAAETFTTTGYGADASWRHPGMVLFSIALQFVGVFLIFLVVPVFLIPFLEERFEARLPRRAPEMKEHVVIYRHGPAVESLLEELRSAGIEVAVLEQDEQVARRLLEEKVPVAFDDASTPSLDGVGLERARALIVNGSDERNAVVILAARQRGFEGDVLALVAEPCYRPPIRLAGATAVFTPRHILAAALAARASLRISPRLSGLQRLGRRLQIDEIRVDTDSSLVGRSLAEADVGARTGATVLGQWLGGHLLTRPSPEMRIEAHGILVAAGSEESLERLEELAGGAGGRRRRGGELLIAGYGEVGRKVVELLREVGEAVRVIDRHEIEGVDVVGDVLDREAQEAAELGSARGVILALDSDSATLFATLVIKDRVPEVPIIARVNEVDNVERIHRAGADFALSISQVSAQMLAQRLLGQRSFEVDPQLRILQVSGEKFEGRRPAELDLRERTGCSVVAVERGEEVITELGGDFAFEPGDAVYVCGSSEQTHRLQRRLAEA